MTEARARRSRGLDDRERLIGGVSAAAFACVVAAMVVLLPTDRALNPGLAVALLATYVVADRVAFRLGAVWVVPTQLVLVPMLFLLPPPVVPLLVTVALVLDRIPEFVSGEIHPSRVLLMVGDGWYAVGPALVFTAASIAAPDWADWPVYVAALGAQFGLNLAHMAVDVTMGVGLRFRSLLKEARSVWLVDALLSPIGLVIAMASVGQPWTFLVALPLLGLFQIFAGEREARIENALVLSRAYRGTAHLMAELLTTSHEYTGHHSRSVVVISHQVGEKLGLDEATLRGVEFGALLHDIGKMAVPNEIINKPGKLTDAEWELMRTHTLEGEQMLGRIGGVLAEVGHVVRSHHEHFDGRGYPDGLSGQEIPVAARIVAASDAFCAMTTDRSYRPAMSIPQAIEELRANSGTQFDPRVIGVLIDIVRSWDPGAQITPEAVTASSPRRFEAVA